MTNRLVFTIVAVVHLVSLAAGQGLAQPVRPGSAHAQAGFPSSASGFPTPWSVQYAEARAAMLAGDFARAGRMFEMLIGPAPDSGSRYLAAEMMEGLPDVGTGRLRAEATAWLGVGGSRAAQR